jgi:hypothetical protein
MSGGTPRAAYVHRTAQHGKSKSSSMARSIFESTIAMFERASTTLTSATTVTDTKISSYYYLNRAVKGNVLLGWISQNFMMRNMLKWIRPFSWVFVLVLWK